MEIINRTGLDDTIVRKVAEHSLVSTESFVVFLDNEANAESDIHACTATSRILASQKLPLYVVAASSGWDLLVYLDATWVREQEMGFVLTLAHELRHAWQYFNSPVVFYSQTPLSWVAPPQLTPCELDAEKAAKRVLRQMYGDKGVHVYLDGESLGCKPEHQEVLERLAALDEAADPNIEAETIALVEQHAAEIRKYQLQYNFVMPGIPELSDALQGRSDVRLRP